MELEDEMIDGQVDGWMYIEIHLVKNKKKQTWYKRGHHTPMHVVVVVVVFKKPDHGGRNFYFWSLANHYL